jgi:hypothetical protein
MELVNSRVRVTCASSWVAGKQGSRFSLSEGTYSTQIRSERTNNGHTEQIRTDQEADQKGPADQGGGPRTYAVEDTWTSAKVFLVIVI